MEEILKDNRFAHIANDPRFKRLPKKEKKVNIDKRFRSMFTDKKFKVKYTIDKRGRPAEQTSTEDLKRYYNLPSSSDSEEEEEEEEEDDDDDSVSKNEQETKKGKQREKGNKEALKRLEAEGSSSENERSGGDSDQVDKRGLTQKVKDKLHDLTVDYARGEGALFSDSSSDDESDDASGVLSEEEIDHGWGELDRDAETTNEVTNRLAVCNMDWDRIRATDLMVLFNSFLPKGGIIHSVTIYPSEFGLERMKEEEVKGPIELLEKNSDDEDDEDAEETEEGKKYHMEKLRQYQLNRLKYYYAVLVCDSPGTANKLYTECDGLEYESSATRLDLRFIPDDTTFDQEPREVCDKLPELTKYQPRYFTTTALQQAKVELTWDETDPNRAEVTQKLMSGKVEDVEDADIKAYLALSSEEEEEEEKDEDDKKDQQENGANESEEETGSQADPISKYRALLQDIEQEEEKKKSKDVEMEVTWGIGLKDKTEKLVKKKLQESAPSLTPFQQYLEKRKEKRKLKKEERQKKIKQQQDGEEEEEEGDKAFSDDELPSDIDMNDPYFKEEFGASEKRSKKKKDKKSKQGSIEESGEEDEQKQAELELLLMNDADDKHHFSLKAIQDQESESKSKRQRKKKKKQLKAENQGLNEAADDFQVNVNDERFSALFSSHLFNIDPADPHYRKTKGMEALRTEKLKRRQEEEQMPLKQQRLGNIKKSDAELSMLVKKIKRRSEELKK